MILTKATYKLESPLDENVAKTILKLIESAARTCYKSECKITEDSYKTFVRKIAQVYKHESVIEHSSFTARFITNRAISHELVRHRLASYSQESTRYVDYSDDGKTEGQCQFIIPPWVEYLPQAQCNWDEKGLRYAEGAWYPIDNLAPDTINWLQAMQNAEDSYKRARSLGWTPEKARGILPNDTKTEIVVTANLRQWRHILEMRTAKNAHPQIREIMCPLLTYFKTYLPELFDDINSDS